MFGGTVVGLQKKGNLLVALLLKNALARLLSPRRYGERRWIIDEKGKFI